MHPKNNWPCAAGWRRREIIAIKTIAKVQYMKVKQKHESKNSTFFWTMEFHIEFIESIIYCLHNVITHHPGQGQHEHM